MKRSTITVGERLSVVLVFVIELSIGVLAMFVFVSWFVRPDVPGSDAVSPVAHREEGVPSIHAVGGSGPLVFGSMEDQP